MPWKLHQLEREGSFHWLPSSAIRAGIPNICRIFAESLPTLPPTQPQGWGQVPLHWELKVTKVNRGFPSKPFPGSCRPPVDSSAPKWVRQTVPGQQPSSWGGRSPGASLSTSFPESVHVILSVSPVWGAARGLSMKTKKTTSYFKETMTGHTGKVGLWKWSNRFSPGLWHLPMCTRLRLCEPLRLWAPRISAVCAPGAVRASADVRT